MSGILGLGPKAQSQTDKRLNAIALNQSAYGSPVSLTYGKTRVPMTLGWYGAFTATPHTTKQAGGKGGGNSGSNTTFTYSAAVIMLLGEGQITGIGTVWNDKAQVTLTDLGLTLFTGAGGQAAWSYMTTNFPSQALGYDHTAYVANGAFQLGNSAALPNLTFEIKALLPFNAGTVDDAEPSAILIDYCTEANHGCGFNYLDSNINAAGTASYKAYCVAMGFFLSPSEQTQRQASEFIREILTVTNSECVWSAGVLKVAPLADAGVTGNGRTYTPDLTPLYSFTDDDYLFEEGEDPVKVTRKAPAERFNVIRIEYLNRANQYNTDIAEAKDANDIALNGERAAPTIRLHCIVVTSVARQVAQHILQRQLYVVNSYSFKVRADYCLLEPLDYVSLNDSVLGLSSKLVRITETEDSEDDEFSITAEEMLVGTASAPLYNWQASQGYAANYAAAPGAVSTPLIFTAPPMLVDTNGGYELWIAVSGAGALWGGCDVYMSLDNSSYAFIGTISGPARHGTLTATLASGTDPDTTHTLSVQLANTALTLVSGAAADVNNNRTLLYVDGEIMAYQTATLTGPGAYNLTTLRRGQYGSTPASHASTTKFARIDGAIFRVPYDAGMVGQTAYFKFCSFNIYGAGYEPLAGATAYSKVLASINAGQNLPGNATLIARGNCAVVGDKIFKSGGSAAWDSDVYSLEAYSAGCLLGFRTAQVGTTGGFMMGLNSDPLTDQTYTSLDFAWFQNYTNGQWDIWESGSSPLSSIGTVAVTDTPQITYDGISVRYYLNGVLKREVQAPGKTFFLDSSFYGPGAAVTDVFFGAATSQPSSRLIARGQCAVVGNSIQKVGGAVAWDSDCYSAEQFSQGCSLSFRAGQTGGEFMMGLNSDPLTDQSYISLDFAWYLTNTGCRVYESGSGVTSLVAYTTADVFSIRYDGQWVRYYQNSTLTREVFAPGLTLFFDSSFCLPGCMALDVDFGPLTSVTPSPFIARGNCKISDNNIIKQGGSTAWDSDCYSIVGYPVCHVMAKANQTNKNFMISLNTDPTTDASYPSLDYAWYCDNAGNLIVYENGSPVATYGTYTTATVIAITYDGATLTYLKDGVPQLTRSIAGLTLFMDSSFYEAGTGINSVRFGPTTNLAVADTAQIGDHAATDILLDSYASNTLGGGAAIPITRNLPAAGTYEVTLTGRINCTAFTSVDKVNTWWSFSGTGVVTGDAFPAYTINANGQVVQISQSLTIVATGAGPWQLQLQNFLTSGTVTVNIANQAMRTTFVKK